VEIEELSFKEGFTVRPKNKKGTKNNDDDRLLQFSYISIIEVFLLGFPMLFYLALKYAGTGEAYGDFAVLLLSLGIIGIMGVLLIQRGKFFKLQNYYLESTKKMLMFLIFTFLIVVILGVSWFLLGSLLKYALEPIELYFYYLGAGIMEEVFFRMFLCGLLKTQVANRFNRQLPDALENIIIAVITATVFMLSHITSYGGDVAEMSTMFVGGVVFTMFYLYTKDISITITAHVIINFIAVGNLLIIIMG